MSPTASLFSPFRAPCVGQLAPSPSIVSVAHPLCFGSLSSLNSTATLVRPARRSRGKCCNKYACTQNAEALCAARIAKEPCNDVCPACYRRVVVTRANPSNGVDCCPVIRCVYNPRDCCNMRDNKACPQPTCDSDLENAVQYAPVVAPQLNCCPRLRCEADAAAVCARRVELDPLGPNTACGACELPAMTREADPANGRCWDRFECLPSPDRCCGFNSSTCPAAPDCGPFADAFVSRPVDAYAGQCCPTYSCANNNTLICDAFTCEYESAEAYMAERCPNPPGRDWYFVEIKRPADVASGICCPKYKCRETTEKKLYDVEQNLSGRRRRRRRAAATTAAPVTTV